MVPLSFCSAAKSKSRTLNTPLYLTFGGGKNENTFGKSILFHILKGGCVCWEGHVSLYVCLCSRTFLEVSVDSISSLPFLLVILKSNCRGHSLEVQDPEIKRHWTGSP